MHTAGDADHHRDRLLVRGLVQLAARGVSVGLDTISLSEAAASSGIAFDDAVALYDGEVGGDPSSAEQSFRHAVAARVLARQPAPDEESTMGSTALEETITAVASVAGTMPPVEDLDAEERGRWLQRLYRAGADANLALADDSVLWRSFAVLTTTVLAQPDLAPGLYEAWRRGDAETSARYYNVISTLASMFGMRLRYCYTGEQFSVALTSISEGFLLRARLEPERHEVERFTGPDGEAETWTLFAVCVEALMRQFFEPVEPGSVSVDHEARPDR